MGIEELSKRYSEFKDSRSWSKFHRPKSIAMSISIEAAELMELFQWHDNLEPEKVRSDDELMEKIRDELADVILYSLSMAHELDIDLEKAVDSKLDRIEERFDQDTAEKISRDIEEWRK